MGILNSLVFTGPPPATTKQLNSLAKRGWDKIEPFVLENLIQLCRIKLKAVREMNGKHTKF